MNLELRGLKINIPTGTKVKKLLLWTLATILLGSCYIIDRETLLVKIKDPGKGLCKQKEYGSLKFESCYRPTALIVDQEIKYSDYAKDTIGKLYDKYKDFHYFLVSISMEGREISRYVENEKRREIIYQLTSGSIANVFLFNERSDTLDLVNCIYAPTYHHSAKTTILYCFKASGDNYDKLFLRINETGLLTGNIIFAYDLRDIQRINRFRIKRNNTPK